MRAMQITDYAYPVLLALMVLVGLCYPQLSPGLAAPGGAYGSGAGSAAGPFYCHQLLSAGGDDDGMITAFSLFLWPLAWRLLRWRAAVGAAERALFWLCTGLVAIALWLASLDCAAILYTAFVLPDPWLATALLALPLAAFCLHRPRA